LLRVADKFAGTDTGRQRRINEDSLYARSPLFAVADGMGGAQAGEVASSIAVGVLEDGLPDGPGTIEERLVELVREANARIHQQSRADEQRAGMGTTLTAAYVGEDEIVVAHVGDSRLYCLRDGEMTRRTHDHSLVEELVREGRLTPQEADEHPQRSIITRALGPENDVVVDHHTWSARDGDVYLLCSDGLTSMVPEARVGEIVRDSPSLPAAGHQLIAEANEAGGRDNITVVLFRVEEVGTESGGTASQDTLVGVPATELPTAVAEAPGARPDAQAAVIEAPPEAPPTEPPRASQRRPRQGRANGRAGPSPPPRRRRLRLLLIAITGAAVVAAPVAIGGYFASQAVYFVGVNGEGFISLYRGLPYDMPGGVSLYKRVYESGVSAASLSPRVRETVTDHKLRSHDDAKDLVRQIELEKLAGQSQR
jgi:PPM family protein phosphatase